MRKPYQLSIIIILNALFGRLNNHFELLSPSISSAQTGDPYPGQLTPTPITVPMDAYPIEPADSPTSIQSENPITTTNSPIAYEGLPTVGLGNIAFSEHLNCSISSNQERKWAHSSFNVSGYGAFSGYWPGGPDSVQPSGSSIVIPYPNDLDTSLACQWNAANIHWQDSITQQKIPPKQLRATFQLWLDLVDTDSVTVTISRGTSRKITPIWSKSYSKGEMPTNHLLAVDTGLLNYGGNDPTENLFISYKFISNATGQSKVGVMVGNLKMYISHGDTPYNTCDAWETTHSGVNRVGINLGYRVPGQETFYINPDDPQVLYDLQNLGVNWVRFVFMPKPSNLDGTALDENNDGLDDIDHGGYRYMIENLCERKINIVPVLGIESLIGIGAQQNDFLISHGFINTQGKPSLTLFIRSPLFLDMLQNRAKELAIQYPKIKNWEILNEPDIMDGFRDNSGRYAETVTVAKEAIKAIIPDAKIIMGGLSNTWRFSGIPFLQNEYRSNVNLLSQGFDELGVHPYTDGSSRGISPKIYFYATDSGVGMILDPLTDIMMSADKVNNTTKPIQITEIGFDTASKTKPIPGSLSTAGGNPCSIRYGTLITPDEQKQYLKEAYEILLPHNRVDKVIWYRYDDIYQAIPAEEIDLDCQQDNAGWQQERFLSVPIGAEDRIPTRQVGDTTYVYLQHWFGIRDIRGNLKPAYCALQEVTKSGLCPLGHPIFLPIIELSRPPLPSITLSENSRVPTGITLRRQQILSSNSWWITLFGNGLFFSTLLFLAKQKKQPILLLGLLLISCAHEQNTVIPISTSVIRLPIIQKEARSTLIPPTLTPTPVIIPSPTSTRPANPYFPIVKTQIDRTAEVGLVAVNSQTNIAYASVNDNRFLMRIDQGIPDFDDEIPVPRIVEELLFDEETNRLYAMSNRYVGEIVEGITVLENDQVAGYVPFPGYTWGMVLDSTRGWVYVYGEPNHNLEPEFRDGTFGVLMIIEGTTVIKVIKPWNVRVTGASADPATGQVYFTSEYGRRTPRPDDTTDPYGRITIFDGLEQKSDFDGLLTNVHSLFFHPKHNTMYAFTYGWQDYNNLAVFENGEMISYYRLEHNNMVVDGTIHPWTDEFYLLDKSADANVLIGTDEKYPTFKKHIPLHGTKVGFDEIIADPFSGNVYVRNVQDSTITVIHDEEVIGVLELTRDTGSMALNPTNGDLYVSSSRAGDIWILGFDEESVFP